MLTLVYISLLSAFRVPLICCLSSVVSCQLSASYETIPLETIQAQIMELFSLFRSSPEKQIERARKKVREPHGDPATRMNAAHRLGEMGTPEALLALLDRFTINVSPSGQDEQEKEEVLSWIVQMGKKAVPPLVQFLKREKTSLLGC